MFILKKKRFPLKLIRLKIPRIFQKLGPPCLPRRKTCERRSRRRTSPPASVTRRGACPRRRRWTQIQGAFFNCTPLNLAKSQSLYKIPYSNFFSPILLLGLGLRQIQGGTVKKSALYRVSRIWSPDVPTFDAFPAVNLVETSNHGEKIKSLLQAETSIKLKLLVYTFVAQSEECF